VIDQLRRHKREATVLSTDDKEDLDDLLFAPDGHWREMPADWGNPDDVLRQRQFFDVMQACLDVLPPAQARVFMMREWLELSSDEVCKELAITTTNLWVLLHRARLRLRECLQAGWFDVHPTVPATPAKARR
jgi:RNA polymerase sigma-70 factor (ECF subfamily)